MMKMEAAKRRSRVELLDDRMVAVLRGKTATERVAMVFDAERTMRLLLEAHLHWRNPEWGPAQVAAEIARRRRLGSS
jgi:hypothetical protein